MCIVYVQTLHSPSTVPPRRPTGRCSCGISSAVLLSRARSVTSIFRRHPRQVGVDQSSRLCAIGRDRGHQTVTAGCLPLPVRAVACDAVICIAVLHHLATRVSQRPGVTRWGEGGYKRGHQRLRVGFEG